MLYICNSFSLGMLPEWRLSPDADASSIRIEPVSAEQARAYIAQSEDDGHRVFSVVELEELARMFSADLARHVQVNKIDLSLCAGDRYLFGQYKGPNFIEGTFALPPGARIAWLVVSLEEAQ